MNARRRLLIDADDTLWPNAHYFVAARRSFCERVAEDGLELEAVRLTLRRHEDAALARGEYGSRRLPSTFMAAALECYDALPKGFASYCEELARSVAEHPIDWYPGALDTLRQLRGEVKELVLVTMGDPTEQEGKILRSGARHEFDRVIIAKNKTRDLYVDLRHPGHDIETWMVGNSPKKDIGPARAAGLQTVLVHTKVEMPSHFTDGAEPAHHMIDTLADLPSILRPSTS